MSSRLLMGIAVVAGVVTLALYFVNLPIGLDIRTLLVEWVSTLAAVALLIGIVNLIAVHLRKVGTLAKGWVYSLILFVTFLVVFSLGLIKLAVKDNPIGQNGLNFAFTYVQTPIEAALAAVLGVVLIVAGARLIYRQRSWGAVLFILIAAVILLGLAPLNDLSFMQGVSDWVRQVPAAGGARGILLGIALGVLTAGLRVIIGADRPYGE
jgi:hypothetical protein